MASRSLPLVPAVLGLALILVAAGCSSGPQMPDTAFAQLDTAMTGDVLAEADRDELTGAGGSLPVGESAVRPAASEIMARVAIARVMGRGAVTPPF